MQLVEFWHIPICKGAANLFCSILFRFVGFYLNLPKSVIAFRSKEWSQICLSWALQGKTRRGGEEQRVEGRGSDGGGVEVTTDPFLFLSSAGQKVLSWTSVSIPYLFSPCLFTISSSPFRKSHCCCFHALTGNCHPKFENSGRLMAWGDVRVRTHVFV